MRRLLTLVVLAVAATLPAIDLSFDEAFERAVDHSYALRRADLDLATKGEALNQAKAERLPEIGLQVSSSFLSNPPEGISIEPGAFGYVDDPTSTYPTPVPDTATVLVPDPENTYFQIKADALWPFFTWGKLEAAERIAGLELEGAGVAREKTRAELERDLGRAYFGLKLALESERLLGEAVAVYSEIVQDRERAFDEGAVNLESVLDARSTLRTLESQLVAAAEGRRTALAGLRYLTGVEGEISPTDLWREDVPALSVDDLVDRAAAWSPDLRALALQVAQAREFEAIQEASTILRPDLALSIGFEISGQRIPLTPNWGDDWDAGLTVSIAADMTAWDWGKRASAAREAGYTADLAATGLAELDASLEATVQAALEQAIAAAAVTLEKRAAAELAQERVKNAQVSFENDLVTREQALGAQILALSAQLEALAAGFAVETALLDLEFIVGERLGETR